MPDTPNDLSAALRELDDGYLHVQLLLAVRRGAGEEPRRAGLWQALGALLAAEQQRRRQDAALTGEDGGSVGASGPGSAVDDVREELRRDAAALDAEYGEALGEFPSPAGQAPEVASVDEVTAPPEQ